MPQPLRIALAAGDGIGRRSWVRPCAIFKSAGVMEHAEFVPVEMGASVFAKGNTRGMSDEAVRVTEDCGILFKGPMETPKGGGGKSINVTARKLWSTFANFRTFETLPGVSTVYSKAGINLDFSIVRENIEDTYGGVEHRLARHGAVQTADLRPGERRGPSLRVRDRPQARRQETLLRPQGQYHEDDRRAVPRPLPLRFERFS